MLSYHLHLSPLTETRLFKKRPWLQFEIFYRIVWSVNTVAQMLVHHCQQECTIKVTALSSRPHNTIIFSIGGTVVVVWGYGYFGATNILAQAHPRPQAGSGLNVAMKCFFFVFITFALIIF